MAGKKSKKYLSILEAGKELLYKYGLKKISVEDICVEAGASKMTFYKFFKNKNNLVMTLMDDLYVTWFDRYRHIMYSESLTFDQKVKQLMETKLEGVKNKSNHFVLDLHYSNDPEIKEYMSMFIRRSIESSIELFRDAQDRGWMRKDLKPELLILLTDKMVEITLDQKVLDMYDNNIEELIREITKFYLYGISDEK